MIDVLRNPKKDGWAMGFLFFCGWEASYATFFFLNKIVLLMNFYSNESHIYIILFFDDIFM